MILDAAGLQADRRWMHHALRLAERGFTPPNPMVGCVIVRDGELVGEGFHPQAGEPHAEVFALRQAGELAKGATVYVTLEPCSHQGRTPPCADKLIEAGVSRVVAATVDNNVRVSGQGIQKLRAAGIEVAVGVLESRARELNAAFLHFHAAGGPLLTVKAALTLDGKTATRTGDSKWITGPAARRFVHLLRARSGAVLAGIGTVLADDAALTARLKEPPPRQPLRIILDSRLRTPPDCAAVRAAEERPEMAPLLIATTYAADRVLECSLVRPGVEVLRLSPNASGRVDLRALCVELAKREVISILCEGGAELNAALLSEGLVDRLLLFVAPKLVGGRDAPGPFSGAGVCKMADAESAEIVRIRRFGPDIAIEATVRRKDAIDDAAGS